MADAARTDRVISVIIADDQVLFSQGLRRIIEISARDIRVIAIASDGREVLSQVRRDTPDVVLMDVRMPGLDGVEATRLLHKEFPAIRILMLTTFDNDEYVQRAVEYGAAGYLLKDIPPEELFDAIRAVHSRSIILSPTVARRLSGATPGRPEDIQTPANPDTVTTALTDREKEVLVLIMQEFDNKSIADRMCLSERTVRNLNWCEKCAFHRDITGVAGAAQFRISPFLPSPRLDTLSCGTLRPPGAPRSVPAVTPPALG